jgi:thiamine pyrophosphate-dependent acetolactate synthase large subunit-like protein
MDGDEVMVRNFTLARREAVKALLADRKDLLVITGLGSASYDVFDAGEHPANFYLWGAMGGAAMVGLGLAQAQPKRPVAVITGDGEQLMGIGGLATIGVARPRNLDIVVIDNQHFGETGMQASHTGRGVDLTAIAAACGFAATGTARTIAEVEGLAAQIAEPADGPRLFVIKVLAENPPRSLPSRDAVFVKIRFRAHLGFAAA